jgi:hypothetical protein
MIDDSKQLKGRIHWFSSMCGKKATLKTLRQELHAAGIHHHDSGSSSSSITLPDPLCHT